MQYINRSYRRTVTLWDSRYKSSLVQAETYLLECQRYIELNPVRAAMVDDPGHYRWTSYRANGLGQPDMLLSPHPLYRALQAVFGELDAAGVTDDAPQRSPAAQANDAPATDARTKAVWESWKSRLPPACGKVIDALLLHGELNQAQLKVAARLGTSTVSDSVYKLNKAGLINKNGGRVSLKQL